MPGMNTIGWFEIGTDDPATAERFYGDLFGWAVTHDPAVSADPAYRLVTTADGEGMRGGLVTTDGAGAGPGDPRRGAVRPPDRSHREPLRGVLATARASLSPPSVNRG